MSIYIYLYVLKFYSQVLRGNQQNKAEETFDHAIGQDDDGVGD